MKEIPGSIKNQVNRRLFLLIFSFFLLFFCIIYSLLRYKKWHGALAMAKAKPKIKNKQRKQTSIISLVQKGPYWSLAHMLARKSIKNKPRKPSYYTADITSNLVFVTGRGGAGFHFVTPPLLRPGVNSLPFLPAPYDTGPWPGCGAGRVFYFHR